MSENSNKIKSEQLGIPFGTASNRLRKSIMFQLVQQTGKDACYRCGEKIDDIDNFSIEHIKDWLHSENPKELFFDLNNIAFSHHDCNTKARRAKQISNGKSKLKGVYYHGQGNRKKKWTAQICYDGKTKYIGRYDTEIEAGKAYDKKSIEIFGEKAMTNKLLGLL